MNWFLKLIYISISDFLQGVVEVFSNYVNNIFDLMYKINNDLLNLDTLNTYTSSLALAFVGFFAVKQGLEVYALNTEGDPDADPLELITRISTAVAVIMCGNWILEQLIKLSGYIANDSNAAVLNVLKVEDSFGTILSSLLTVLVSTSDISSLIVLIFVVIMVIAFFIFIYQAGKRGVDLILFELMMPFLACDLLTTNKERWNSFFTELIITVFGFLIQLLCFKIFMKIFAGVVGVIDPLKMIDNILLSLAWLISVINSPKWLQKFSYTSGIGNTMKGGLRSSTFLLQSLMRK